MYGMKNDRFNHLKFKYLIRTCFSRELNIINELFTQSVKNNSRSLGDF